MRGLFVLLVVVSLSGCFGDPPLRESFGDADERFVREGEDLDVVVAIPEGNATVKVAVHYRLEAESDLTAVVRVIDGPELASINQFGPVEEKDASWLTIHNVTASEWRLEATLEGAGAYVFAFYFEAPAPSGSS